MDEVGNVGQGIDRKTILVAAFLEQSFSVDFVPALSIHGGNHEPAGKERVEQFPYKIGLIGHSEGGIIASYTHKHT